MPLLQSVVAMVGKLGRIQLPEHPPNLASVRLFEL
jgi:hypothetical protein